MFGKNRTAPVPNRENAPSIKPKKASRQSMEEKHFIQWIYIQTEQGGQRKAFKPGDKPEAVFELTAGDKFVAAYEYCNLHGLWKK